ncbi:protein kinase [Chloroflexales bacterium ZM16-3]|nr:protein kinase [Chloroflexales bacterium ZM16-3]
MTTQILEPGTVVYDRYRVVRLMGQGGMGAVYEVVDQRLGNTLALKQMTVTGDQMKHAFEREAQLLAELRHSALPKVIDHFSIAEGTFLAMEFISGDDLATMLDERQNEPFPVDIVLAWAEQLLDVLHYLHSRAKPIIHRDIKPQNLKLTPEGAIILLDFGLAKGTLLQQSQTQGMQSIFGYTPQYAPPEQIQGSGTDPRSDLYSLAATLYCLLTGIPPEGALVRLASTASSQRDPLRSAHAVNPRVPVAFSDLLQQALSLSAASRPASAYEMRATLQNSDLRTSRLTATTRPQWILPVSIGGGVVLLVAVVAAIVLGMGAGAPAAAPTASSAAIAPESTVTALVRASDVVPPDGASATATAEADVALASATSQAKAATASAVAAAQVADDLATASAVALDKTAVAVDMESTMVAQITAIAGDSARPAKHRSDELGTASTSYDPAFEPKLLESGYTNNIVTVQGHRVLQPSQSEPILHTWVRDLDYAMNGYSYALGNMTLLRDNTQLFLDHVEDNGIVPDVFTARGYDSNGAWDSMPNLIHATYAYVAKTGDRAFYQKNQQKLHWVGDWIASLDSDGDGLPDRDEYPNGYYNSITNSVRHTYALAMFYSAFRELAELDRAINSDGALWDQRAESLRSGFNRPFNSGGYWVAGQAWPVAWRDPGQEPVSTLETFGVFEALRAGLIAPGDDHYPELMRALHERLPDLMKGQTPLRLALDGYAKELLVPAAREQWKLDASAPWIVGPAALAYTAAGYPTDAQRLIEAYKQAAGPDAPKVVQLAAVNSTGSEGQSGAWGSAAWFMAIYGGHYGLTMTPSALIVQPRPFISIPADTVQNLSYQGALVQLSLNSAAKIYQISVDRPTAVILRPMGDATLLQVDDGPEQSAATMVLQPGQSYLVRSLP